MFLNKASQLPARVLLLVLIGLFLVKFSNAYIYEDQDFKLEKNSTLIETLKVQHRGITASSFPAKFNVVLNAFNTQISLEFYLIDIRSEDYPIDSQNVYNFEKNISSVVLNKNVQNKIVI